MPLSIYYNEHSRATPDGQAMEEAQHYWHVYSTGDESVRQILGEIWTGSHLVITAFCVLVRRGTIPPTELQLYFASEGRDSAIPLTIYPSGGIAPRPSGFCDHWGTMMLELL